MEIVMGNGYANGWLLNRINRLRSEMDWQPESATSPATDVVEHEDGYHFYFEMPGIKPDSVDVRVEEGRLVVEAERKRPEWPKEAEIHLAERTYGRTMRAFALPDDANSENITAAYRDGVLEVTVPKKPGAKPTRIKINFANN
ncbi:MAG TPA: Hsp20/alpha crystallin family protein [Candidatus Binataceae bacterium]|nr:Hsp20/alpha crystallin family protein [Candidatus Binataceae bacterium]